MHIGLSPRGILLVLLFLRGSSLVFKELLLLAWACGLARLPHLPQAHHHGPCLIRPDRVLAQLISAKLVFYLKLLLKPV